MELVLPTQRVRKCHNENCWIGTARQEQPWRDSGKGCVGLWGKPRGRENLKCGYEGGARLGSEASPQQVGNVVEEMKPLIRAMRLIGSGAKVGPGLQAWSR